jgi:hypothetical protein
MHSLCCIVPCCVRRQFSRYIHVHFEKYLLKRILWTKTYPSERYLWFVFKLYGECGSSSSGTCQQWDKGGKNFQIVRRTKKKKTRLYREGYWAVTLLSRVCVSRDWSLGTVVIHVLPQSPGSADRVPLMLLSHLVTWRDFHSKLLPFPDGNIPTVNAPDIKMLRNFAHDYYKLFTKEIRDKWVPVTPAWPILRSRLDERPPDMEGGCEYTE